MTASKAILRFLAATEITVAVIFTAAFVVVLGLTVEVSIADWMMLPTAAGFVNLVAALLSNTQLRSQPMLFGFHALLALFMVAVVAERLTSLSGHVEMTEGTMFDPSIAVVDAAPLHNYHLDQIAFVQGPFEIRYAPGMRRRETISHVRIRAGNGIWTETQVGDDRPMTIGDYRLYTSFNKGFAPVVTFRRPDGVTQTGAIHLPSFPLNAHRQGNEWQPPGAVAPLTIWLQFDDPIYDEENRWTFRKPVDPRLVVVDGDVRHVLMPGERAIVSSGTLSFDGVRNWMGYTIVANPLAPWLMAIAVTGGLALIVHVWDKFGMASVRRRPEARNAA